MDFFINHIFKDIQKVGLLIFMIKNIEDIIGFMIW
jgi:hypothetical protein